MREKASCSAVISSHPQASAPAHAPYLLPVGNPNPLPPGEGVNSSIYALSKYHLEPYLNLYAPARSSRRSFTVKDISHRSDDDSAADNDPGVERFTKHKITQQRCPDQLQE